MQVIFDTNIIASDFHMKSSKFKFLFAFSERIPFNIVIPEVVYDEVINKYREMLEKQNMIYNKSTQQLKAFFKGNIDFLTFDINNEVENYKDFLDDLDKSKKVKLIPYPKTKHKDIVLHELSRKKPFKENGAGYRDMLIIDSIFERFIAPEETIVFISNNSNDFGLEPKFHDDLFFEKNVSNRYRFIIKNSLSSFLDEYINPILKIDEDIKTIPQLSKITGLNISDWVLNNIEDIIYDNGVGRAILGLDDDYGSVMIDRIDSIKSISIANVIKLDDGSITCDVIIDGTFVMYVSADGNDCMRSKSLRELFDYNISEGNIHMIITPLESAEITISTVIDSSKGIIDSYYPKTVKNDYGWVDFNW